MKELYERTDIKITEFCQEDVIITSDNNKLTPVGRPGDTTIFLPDGVGDSTRRLPL